MKMAATEDRPSDLEIVAEAILSEIDWTPAIIDATNAAWEKLFSNGALNDSARRWIEGEGFSRLQQHERRAVIMQMGIVLREKLQECPDTSEDTANVVTRATLTAILACELAREELFRLRCEIMNCGTREDAVVTNN